MRQKLTRKIGVLGGSFDPVHLGHLIIAEHILGRLGLDTVLFIPCNIPPHKRAAAVAPAAHRMQMVRCAVRGNPRFQASDMEIVRGGVSYSVDTLRTLRVIYSDSTEIYFIIGADSLMELASWREYRTLLSLCRIVTAARPGFVPGRWPAQKGLYTRSEIAAIRRYCVHSPLIEISSTEIRRRSGNGLSIRYMVPDAVARYITARGLYRR